MDFNQETAKLTFLFALTNLTAAILGFTGFVVLGVLEGLIIFALMLVILPIGLEYVYLRQQTNSDES